MTDFEVLVGAALESGADQAPDAIGLADAARVRSRRRRRARTVGVLAAAAIVVAAVGVTTLGGAGSDSGRVAEEPTVGRSGFPVPADGHPSGWKVERWQGLEVAVPGDWEIGTRSSWCAYGTDSRGSAERGRVQRPDTAGRLIGCLGPAYSFGLTFGSSARFDSAYESGHVWRYTSEGVADADLQYVSGSWLGLWYDDDRLVQVNAGDRETVQQVIDSIRAVD